MKIAVVQFAAEACRPSDNRRRLTAYIEEAASLGASIVILPELAVSGYVLNGDKLAAVAESIDGPTLACWTSLAAKHGLLIAGGFCEKGQDGQLYNSAMLVGADGLLLHYRKLHLFDYEKKVFAPGNLGLPVADTWLGRIGLCVCYDLRFVEVLRLLALQGVTLAAVPTAWVGGFDQSPRDQEGFITQARGVVVQANLNQVYVACASQAGIIGNQVFLGNSLIVDPFGKVLSGPLDDNSQCVIVADYSPQLALAAQHRSELINPRDDRRTDVYGVTIVGARSVTL